MGCTDNSRFLIYNSTTFTTFTFSIKYYANWNNPSLPFLYYVDGVIVVGNFSLIIYVKLWINNLFPAQFLAYIGLGFTSFFYCWYYRNDKSDILKEKKIIYINVT